MPNKADVKAWKAQLVAQAEQQILKLTDSDQFKKYLNTLAKFHRYSARNIDLIYAQNPQANQVWFMADGYILEKGSPSEMFDNPQNERAKDFIGKIIEAK